MFVSARFSFDCPYKTTTCQARAAKFAAAHSEATFVFFATCINTVPDNSFVVCSIESPVYRAGVLASNKNTLLFMIKIA